MENNRNKVLLFLILAPIFWSTAGFLIKFVNWNPVAIAGTRSGISAITIFIYILFFRKDINPTNIFSKDYPKWLGAFIYAGTVIVFVIANKMTAAANVIFLQYSAPIWVGIFSGLFLNEKISKFDWKIILIVFSGIGLFFFDSLEYGQTIGNILSIISGILLAGVIIMMKKQVKSHTIEMVLLGNIITFIISIPFVFQSMPDLKSIIGLILLGVFQLGFAYIFFSEAVPHVTAIEAILIPAIEPLLSPLWVFLLLGEKPGFFAIIGGIIVLFGVVYRSIVITKKKNLKNTA